MFSANAFSVFAYPILVIIILLLHWKGNADAWLSIARTIFGTYIVETLKVTLFPLPVDGLMAGNFAHLPFLFNLNLNPLNGWQGSEHAIKNVVLGVPFGFGLWFVRYRTTSQSVLLMGAAFSLTLEMLQLLLGASIGFMYRTVDILDLILNVAGVALGIAGFWCTCLFYRLVARRLELHEGGGMWTFLGQRLG